MNHDHCLWGLTAIGSNRFATCDSSDKRKVFFWTLRDETIVCEDPTYDLEHKSDDIHYNGTYYAVLHSHDNAITVMNIHGKRLRKIVIEEAFGKKIKFSYGIRGHGQRNTQYICVLCT